MPSPPPQRPPVRRLLSRRPLLRTGRRLGAAAVPLVLALLAAGCGGASSASDSSTGGSGGRPTESTQTAAAVTLNGEWPLTGEPLDGDLPHHPVYAVKIDNTSSSAPQIGLGKADMVVEEMVEGGLTRLAVFYYSQLPGVVGPVRSMRASDIGILKPVSATMIASGGANKTIRRLAGAHVRTLTEGVKGFYRDSSRAAPYNLFDKLSETAAKSGGAWSPPQNPYLPFGPASDFAGTIPVKTIDAVFSGSHTTHWKYTDKGWVRPDSYAKPGDDFVADNVLLLRVKIGDAGYLDPGGYPVPETLFYGKGDAVLVHGDKALQCRWSKEDKASSLMLSTAKGAKVTVPAGHTWIELVPSDKGRVTLGK
jgi:Protein of unknown function (DUF3048) N-terminal domain/Protein of unknown function (DUF3048) C-terminal domain